MPAEARRHPGRALALTLVLALAPAAAGEVPLETLLAERRYEEALASLLVRTEEWALEVKRNDSPAARLDWARSLLSLGMVEDRLGRYESAINHLRQALELIESAEGPEALAGDCHDALGLACSHDGRHAEAEHHLLKAIAIRRTAPEDEREPWLSASRDHLGLSYLQEGRYREAGPLFHQSLEATAADNRELLAQRLGYLARYYQTLHSHARARNLLREALTHAEATWGRDHPNTLTLLGQLGLVAGQLGELAESRAILEEVTDLARASAGDTTGRLRLAGFLNNLGSIALLDGDLEQAQAHFREALEVLERTLAPDHLALAPLRNNLACSLQDAEAFGEAEKLFLLTREAYLRQMGPDHQRSVEALANLALNTLLQSGPPAARGRIAETAAASGLVLERLIRFGSERQRLNYLNNVDFLSLACSAGEDAGLIADALLSTKGRLLDVMLTESTRGEDPVLAEFRATREKLDLLLLYSAEPDADRLAALRSELQALEAKLNARATPGGGSKPPGWQEVQAKLPAGSAFIDFVRFTDHTADRATRYGAVLLLPTGPPAWIPLAGEKDLQTWLEVLARRLDYRAATLAGEEAPAPVLALKPGLRQLHDQFWAPVEEALPEGIDSLCFCPDGSLNFLSFAILLDEENRFLADRFPLCTYVSSGRDLLLPARSARLTDAPWQVFAVDRFATGEAPSTDTAFQEALARTVSKLEPLAGAKREASLLKPFLAPDSEVHSGEEAREATLRKIPPSPAVLHLITHGFFLGKDGALEGDGRLQDFEDNPLPLYLSGLVLQGARKSLASRPAPDPLEDDILFASDVADLPLRQTELVTLSSCQSALGASLAGEGVLGLRRGFASAGARNLLLTLWPVSDDTTPDYMRRFYELALETGHLSQAAWQAQREGLAGIDPDNAEQLESAVLTMGPFILCQRQGLSPPRAFSPPSPPSANRPLYIGIAVGVGLASAFFLLTRRKG